MEPKLTKREWMATMILVGLESSFDMVNRFLPNEEAISLAVEMADKLSKKLNEKPKRKVIYVTKPPQK